MLKLIGVLSASLSSGIHFFAQLGDLSKDQRCQNSPKKKGYTIWVWGKVKPLGIGLQVLVHVSIG